MADPSPFDDDQPHADGPEPAPAAKRERRPWWRWNLVTLFGTLFVVIWARELGGWSDATVWTVVPALFFAWWLIPAIILGPPPEPPLPHDFQPSTAPAMPEPHSESHQRLPASRRWNTDQYRTLAILRGLRMLSLVTIVLALLSLGGMIAVSAVQWLGNSMGGYGGGPFGGGFLPLWYAVVSSVIYPLLVVLLAGVLYTLTVIADHLIRDSRER